MAKKKNKRAKKTPFDFNAIQPEENKKASEEPQVDTAAPAAPVEDGRTEELRVC